jgi:transmembrane sensor
MFRLLKGELPQRYGLPYFYVPPFGTFLLFSSLPRMSSPFNNEQLLEQALEWFFMLQSEDCTDEDRRRFNLWYRQSEENQAAYAHAECLWSDLDQIKEEKDNPRLKKARRHSRRSPARMLGMSVLLLVSSALAVAGWMDYSAETITYSTRKGERQAVVLDDGTAVDLNTATRLHATISLLRRRIVLDQGEAIFDVRHESLRPFKVQAGDLAIRDIGTRFSARRHGHAVSVAVLQGAIEINGERVEEGYQRNYLPDTGLSSIQPIDAEQVEAWKHGRLVFRKSPLRDVIAELERYHSVRIVFADPSLARQTLSGTFDIDDLELFLASVEKILPVQVQLLLEEGERMFLMEKTGRK